MESLAILMKLSVTFFTLALMENILKRSVKEDFTLKKTLELVSGLMLPVVKIAKSIKRRLRMALFVQKIRIEVIGPDKLLLTLITFIQLIARSFTFASMELNQENFDVKMVKFSTMKPRDAIHHRKFLDAKIGFLLFLHPMFLKFKNKIYFLYFNQIFYFVDY